MKQLMRIIFIVMCLPVSLFGEAQQELNESSLYATGR